MKPDALTSIARGLLVLALLVIAGALWRAHLHHTLGAGWWKPW